MSEAFDIYTIIFLVLAVFIILRLRSVLGTRTGHERPPQDPYAPRDRSPATGVNENVVTLPKRRGTEAPLETAGDEISAADRWKGLVAPGSGAEAGLDAIAAADRRFDAESFLQGAKAAYEMIVTAFAQGNRRELKPLLATEVFESFSSVIADRESRGETAETTFVSIDKAEITDAELKGRQANVTVRFVSQLISATRNKAGEVIDGNAESVIEVVDVWTFAHDVGSSDPNWKLIATESAE
ncbi:calcium-binding protein [Agaricicola taiwanensis]|uniref:Calcium-binding protein n=1 Tax=Agaricicola taiwanensis TaxID=591372 RepID=A0A8J2VKT4_9RHOB|nr:Tim44/TimA family putative adaptor protein [Agaricicola taiwanensis]GGE28873.1 calcium-binding protein [Agaricicola taiwanensis]